MAIALGAALYSQLLGLTFLVGAFYAGLLISQAYASAPTPRTFVSSFTEDGLLVAQPTETASQYRAFDSIFTTMNWMFFIPLFFALVGVEMDLRDLGGVLAFGIFVVFLVMALATKLGTGAGLTRALGLSSPDAVAAGFLLSSRGAIGLAMAVLLLADRIFSPALFTTVALVSLATTIVSPLGALWAWRSNSTSRAELESRMPSVRQGRPLRMGPSIDEPPLAPPGRPRAPRPPSSPPES
jgi:Kef-type K+ transport system membrane component KefB